MTHLRKIMLEELQRRHYSEATTLSLVIIENAASSPQVKVTETRVADLYRRVGRDCVSKC